MPILTWCTMPSSGSRRKEVLFYRLGPGGSPTEQTRELLSTGINPFCGRKRIRPERLQVTFLFVVKQGAMKTQSAGFGIVAEAGRIVGAHLEEHAHFKFAESFAAEEPVHIIKRVEHRNHVDAVARAV